MKHSWEHTVKPQKKNSWKGGFNKKRKEFIENKSLERYNTEVEGVVLKNVYRDQYGLPADLKVREPDQWVKQAVKDSYVAERTKLLQKYSIDPNLVFFHHELDDLKIGWCIRRLHGDYIKDEIEKKLHRQKLHFISEKLAERRPEMMLMFAKIKKYIAVAPGFIHVPVNFTPDNLNEFLQENLELHRHKSKKFILEYKDFEDIEKEI